MMAHKHHNNNEIIHEVMGKFSPNSKSHKIKKKWQFKKRKLEKK